MVFEMKSRYSNKPQDRIVTKTTFLSCTEKQNVVVNLCKICRKLQFLNKLVLNEFCFYEC